VRFSGVAALGRGSDVMVIQIQKVGNAVRRAWKATRRHKANLN
jgi:hypothetical protein